MTDSMIPADHVLRRIHIIRGQRVILDVDLAELYGVSTKRLNEQVYRNVLRFPTDFMFKLTKEENANLISQRTKSSLKRRGGRRKLHNAFTEHGAIMAANVLNSPEAVQASVSVVRAFVYLRQMVATNKRLIQKLAELERRLDTHDQAILDIFTTLRDLMEPPAVEKPKIGFRPK